METPKNPTVERDKRVKNVAPQVIAAFAEDAQSGDLPFPDPEAENTQESREKLFDYHHKFYEEQFIWPVVNNGMTEKEVKYMFRMMKQPFALIQDTLRNNVDKDKVEQLIGEVMMIVANEAEMKTLMYGSGPDLDKEDFHEYYQELFEDVLKDQLQGYDLTIGEYKYLFEQINQPFDFLEQVFDGTIDQRKQKLLKEFTGEIKLDEIPLDDMNEYLKGREDDISNAVERAEQPDGWLVRLAKSIESYF